MRASVQRLLKNTTPDGEMDAFELATYTLTASEMLCVLSYPLSELSLNKLKRTVPSLQREDAVEEPKERRKKDEQSDVYEMLKRQVQLPLISCIF